MTPPSGKSQSAQPVLRWTAAGTAAYRRISVALFLAGFATFSLIYCVQPLLPLLVEDFAVSPTASSLSLSLTTGFLAFSILLAGGVSAAFGRRQLMFVSICSAAVLNFIAAMVPDWHAFLLIRALEGFVLGGVPSVAMAYLAEEIHPRGLGLAMGLYISGSAFGGMAGRVGVGLLTDFASWRLAMGALGVIGLICGSGFYLLLPASRNFTRRRGLQLQYHCCAFHDHVCHSTLPLVFLIGALTMGSFVTVYNYATFRLVEPPYNLSQWQVSLIFMVYMFGVFASSIAGALSDKLGRGPVLITGVVIAMAGLLLTLLDHLYVVIGGVAVLTTGFFVAHAIASSLVGGMALQAKGHAAALYLLSYYLGSSVMGSIGGWFWTHGGWNAVVGFAAALLLAAMICAIIIWRVALKVVID